MTKQKSSNSKNSHFLITGGAGFIGSHLSRKLLELGNEVTVIDNLSTGKIENIQSLLQNPLFHFHQEDIFNEKILDQLVQKCDRVFHLAAAVGVKLIMEDTLRTIQTNISGTEVVMQSAFKHLKPVYLASTSEVYGKCSQTFFKEDQDLTLGPTSKNRWAYAASKMIDEFLALAYFREKKLPVIIFRFFNTVGPRQSAQYGMVVPRFIKQALEGSPLTVYGDGQQSRCFCDVEDVVRAMIALVNSPEAIGEVFNIGSNQLITIENLAKKVLAILKDEFTASGSLLKNIPYSEVYAEGFEDIRQRQPDISKIAKFVGWKPEISLDEILRKIIKSLS